MIELYTHYRNVPDDVFRFGCTADGSQLNNEDAPMHFAWEDVNYVLVHRPGSVTIEEDLFKVATTLPHVSEPFRYDMPDGTIFFVLQH